MTRCPPWNRLPAGVSEPKEVNTGIDHQPAGVPTSRQLINSSSEIAIRILIKADLQT